MPISSSSLFFVAMATLALAAIACGGGKTGPTPQPPAQGIEAVIVSSDLAVGRDRFVVGLVDRAKNALIIDAQLHFRIFQVTGDKSAVLKAEIDARPLTIEKSFTHVHQDGNLETHGAGAVGVYVAQVELDSPGQWGVQITGTRKDGRPLPTLAPAFTVQERSRAVPLGAAAPRTRQLIVTDVKDLSEIDTSNPPNPDMHSMTVADAVTSGTPTVVVFATPSFCMSRTCGPVKETVDQLYGKYKGRANFVHIEPYDLPKAQSGQGLVPVPAMREWGLQTEPWVFLVGNDGKMAAKFEGIVSFQELEVALEALLVSASDY